MVNNKFTPEQLNLIQTQNVTVGNNINSYNFSSKREELANYKHHIRKAKYFHKKGELMDAYQYYGMAKTISVNIFWHEAEAYCLMAIGSINAALNKFDAAYKNYMECLNLVLDKDIHNSLSLIYFNLSNYYKKINQPKLSKSYSEKAINSTKKTTILE